MSRHMLLIGAAFLGTPCISAAVAQSPDRTVSGQASAERNVTLLADGWRFHRDDTLSGAESANFDDAGWETVSVPHSWNRVGYYGPNTPGRINTAETVNKDMGIGWYRRRFETPGDLRGKRVWLEFDAASRIATVWLNGRLLGEHRGGYSRFRLDATAALAARGPNLLVVKTDNTKPAPGSSTADVLPLTGDFFVPGGLYRPVRLVTTDAVHFDMLDAGGPSVYATTRTISDGKATIDVSVGIANDGARAEATRYRATLIDAAGRTGGTAQGALTVRAGDKGQAQLSMAVAGPHLWHGVDDPYLYRLSVSLLSAKGKALDRIDQAFGIRQIAIDAERGFLLNGKPYKLRGVGYHQDRETKGWAIDAADVEADVKTLREMGVTSIRLTHYQHGQPIHDLADRYGLILWDEIPLVSQWTMGGARSASDGLRANARQQLAELIRQNQNHASVAVWGIANELDFGNSLPAFLTGSTGSPPDPAAILAEVNAAAKALDPSRPTALATCCEGRLFADGVSVPITAPAADLGGANRYFGWYYGKPEELGANIDGLRAKRPGQPLSLTEYGAGGAISIHTDNVLGGPVDSRGRAQPEEYEDYVHEGNWAVIVTKPYLWATWLWAGFDFASTVRREGDADDINTKGLVNYDHSTRKDAYYFYKANWSNTGTVRITGRHYVERAYASVDVRVYSNAATTEASVNGVALPPKSGCPLNVCTWTGVTLRAGANDVRAWGLFDGKRVEDAVTWQVSPDVASGMRIDSGTMVVARSMNGRFGSDNFFVGGTAASLVKPADFGKPPVPAVIAGTNDSAIVATYREGDFHYRLPLRAGAYSVTLTFVHPDASAAPRVFDVLVDGKVAVPALDVAKAAGAPMTAFTRTFRVTAGAQPLDLWFRPRTGKAMVSSVQVTPVGR